MFDPVQRLIQELSKLPGIGEKSATRLAFFIIKKEDAYAQGLSEALLNAKSAISLCQNCFTFTERQPCGICQDQYRDHHVICVVEQPSDVNSIEMSKKFMGQYHVLHGSLSPLDGIGPDELKIKELLKRLMKDQDSSESSSKVTEIILAMNPSVEGDATAMYISRLLRPFGVKVTQLAHGIPMGGRLEYTDRQTLGKALDNRTEFRS